MVLSASNSSYVPYAFGISSVAATCRALLRFRDAMASTFEYVPFCIAGMTFFRPISAVLKIPQETFDISIFSIMKRRQSLRTATTEKDRRVESLVNDMDRDNRFYPASKTYGACTIAISNG